MEFKIYMGFPGGTIGKESAHQCRRCHRLWLDPWVRNIPWCRKWKATPVFLSGKFYGQRSLVDCIPWVCKELDISTCTQTNTLICLYVCIDTHTHTHTYIYIEREREREE